MSKDEIITQLEETKDKLSKMEGKYESLVENPQSVNNNIIIFPREFGTENIKVIEGKLGDILSHTIKQHTFKSIPMLFNQIHNNEKLPEYHNVYVASERSSYAMVSNGKKFEYKPKKTIIDQIIEDKRSILNKYVDENGEMLGERVLRKYDKYQDQLDENQEFRKELEIEIGGLLLNMKSVIADDEKTRRLLNKIDEGNFEMNE